MTSEHVSFPQALPIIKPPGAPSIGSARPRQSSANFRYVPHMRRRASRVVRSDGIACRRCRDQPRGHCGTSPHHLISGRLARSLHPSPACTGQSARLEEDGTHLYDGIRALGIPGPHPSRFAASDGGRFASNSGLTLIKAPSGISPCVKYRHKAIISLREVSTDKTPHTP